MRVARRYMMNKEEEINMSTCQLGGRSDGGAFVAIWGDGRFPLDSNPVGQPVREMRHVMKK